MLSYKKMLLKTVSSLTFGLLAMVPSYAQNTLDVVQSGLCNANKVIIKTKDNWYATGIYVDGYQLTKGDQIVNDDVSLQIENRLELAESTAYGHYLITDINETLDEAEATACN